MDSIVAFEGAGNTMHETKARTLYAPDSY